MCPDPRQIEHTAQLRLALVDAFRAGGLRDVEKRTRDILARRCAEPVPDDLVVELDALFDSATPVAHDGHIDLYTDHPTVCDWFPNASERMVFALLAYLTRDGTSIEPVKNPVREFNDEFKADMDDHGHLKPDSRMGRMSDGAYAREKARAEEAGALWLDNRIMYPSQIALAVLSRYGTELPDIMHWRHDADDDDGNRRYAGILSRDELVRYDSDGKPVEVNHVLDKVFVRTLRDHRDKFDADWTHFRIAYGGLFDASGRVPYILPKPDIFHPGIDPSVVPGFEKVHVDGTDWFVHERFIIWLASLDTWDDVAGGVLNEAVVDTLI